MPFENLCTGSQRGSRGGNVINEENGLTLHITVHGKGIFQILFASYLDLLSVLSTFFHE